MTGHGWRDARIAKGITLRALAALVSVRLLAAAVALAQSGGF